MGKRRADLSTRRQPCAGTSPSARPWVWYRPVGGRTDTQPAQGSTVDDKTVPRGGRAFVVLRRDVMVAYERTLATRRAAARICLSSGEALTLPILTAGIAGVAVVAIALRLVPRVWAANVGTEPASDPPIRSATQSCGGSMLSGPSSRCTGVSDSQGAPQSHSADRMPPLRRPWHGLTRPSHRCRRQRPHTAPVHP